MRRLLCFLLLATFGLPLWAPLLALGQPPEASLPACCRRAGKHHCAMSMASSEASSQTAGEQAPAWKAPRERCPFCPGAVSSAYHHEVGSLASTQAAFGYSAAHPLGLVQTESKWRIARDRSRQKRGPPTSLLA